MRCFAKGMAMTSLLVLLGLGGLGADVLGAQPSFAGRAVVVLVGYPPGSGYDRFGRLVARYLSKYLPGSPAIVVQNMPGAGGIVAANHLFHVARPDGLTIGVINPVLVIAQLAGVREMRVDMRRWQWLGALTTETVVFTVRSDLPYRHIGELRETRAPLAVGATSPGNNSYDFPLALKAFAGLNLRIIAGYPGTPDVLLAMERKEIDAYAATWSSLVPHIRRGLLRALLRTASSSRQQEIFGIPVAEGLVSGEVARMVFRLRSDVLSAGRPFVAPPDTTTELVRVYRVAFRQLGEDPAFKAEAERLGFEPWYTPGEEVQRVMERVLAAPPGVQRVFRELFQFGE
jgi:tripartite-type tricarboxylate transporter receptor subunit TctC